MKINVPFIKSRGFECGQACTAMIIKYYYPKFEPNFDKINNLIHHKKGKYTFPLQLALLIDSYNLNTTCFSSEDYKTQEEDPNQFKRWLGKDYDTNIKFFDHKMFDWIATEGRNKKLLTVKNSNFNDLIINFKKGNLVGMPVDWNTLINKNGSYVGHFVVITGIDGDNIFVHDPDNGPYQKYSSSLLKKAWEHPTITNDYLVVSGKR